LESCWNLVGILLESCWNLVGILFYIGCFSMWLDVLFITSKALLSLLRPLHNSSCFSSFVDQFVAEKTGYSKLRCWLLL